MARRLTGGLVGEPSIGAINIAPTAVITAAENQDITLSPVGTGSVIFTNNAQLNARSDLRFADADSSNYVAIEAPATISSNYTLTLPSTDGTTNQVLTTNGSGLLSWTTAAVSIADNTSDSATHYPTITTTTSGTITSARITSTKFTFQPSTGLLTTTELTVNGTARSLRTENVKTASHTIELADRDRVVAMNNTASATVTIPADSTTNFPIGSVVYIVKVNTGEVTLAAAGGVSVSRVGTFTPNEEIYVRKRAANTWSTVDQSQRLSATGGSLSSSAGFTIHTYTSGSSTFVVG
jgi:hypothetical protein